MIASLCQNILYWYGDVVCSLDIFQETPLSLFNYPTIHSSNFLIFLVDRLPFNTVDEIKLLLNLLDCLISTAIKLLDLHLLTYRSARSVSLSASSVIKG